MLQYLQKGPSNSPLPISVLHYAYFQQAGETFYKKVCASLSSPEPSELQQRARRRGVTAGTGSCPAWLSWASCPFTPDPPGWNRAELTQRPPASPHHLLLVSHCKALHFTENKAVAPGDLPIYWQEEQSKKTTIILAKPFQPHLSARLPLAFEHPRRLAKLFVALKSQKNRFCSVQLSPLFCTKKLYSSHYGLVLG